MKIINPERQTVTGSTTSSEDVEFPLENLFDSHPRNVTKAASGQTMTLRLKIQSGSNALACFNTNAKDVICTITADGDEQFLDAGDAIEHATYGAVVALPMTLPATLEGGIPAVGIPCTGHGYSAGDVVLIAGTTNYDGMHTVLESPTNVFYFASAYTAETFAGSETVILVQATQTYDLQLIDSYERFIADNPVVYRQFWMDYPYQIGACTATITLTSVSPAVVFAGCFKAGAAFEFPNPQYGLQEGRKSYGVKKRLNNGALYGRVRNIVRSYSGSLILKRAIDETDQYKAFMDLYDQFGEESPFAAIVADDIEDNEWALLCTNDSPFTTSHAYPEHSVVSFSWLEEV